MTKFFLLMLFVLVSFCANSGSYDTASKDGMVFIRFIDGKTSQQVWQNTNSVKVKCIFMYSADRYDGLRTKYWDDELCVEFVAFEKKTVIFSNDIKMGVLITRLRSVVPAEVKTN